MSTNNHNVLPTSYHELLDKDERLDFVIGTDIPLIQKIDGTAFAIDTILLAYFVKISGSYIRVADLGSGNGILSFILKYKFPHIEIVGFEIQPELYQLSLRNLQINNKMHGISFELLDVRDIPAKVLPESFDIVVSNPPYYPLGRGRLPPDYKRAISRHEITATLKDFVEAASWLVPYGGKFCLVIPSNRFYELCEYLQATNFGLKRVQFIHPKAGQQAHLALVEAEKFFYGKHEPLPSITIHNIDGSFTAEIQHIFQTGLRPK